MYCNVNFNVFFKLIKVHFLASELYVYQNVRCNDKKVFVTVILNNRTFVTIIKIKHKLYIVSRSGPNPSKCKILGAHLATKYGYERRRRDLI